MCSEGKCCGCIRVETGSLIFGVISAVFWALKILGCVILLVWFNVFIDIGDRYKHKRMSSTVKYHGEINIIIGINVAVGLLNFFFAVLLCDGINKKKTSYIMAYLIYGIVISLLACLGVCVLFFLEPSIVWAILAVPIVIYGFILHMINLTIKQISASGSASASGRQVY